MKILQIEFLKLFRLSTYVLFGIILVFLIAGSVFTLQFSEGPDKMAMMKNLDSGQVEMMFIFFTIFVIMNIGQEFSENTLRKSIIEGYTRTQFFIGKVLLVILAAVFILTVQKLVFLAAANHAGQLYMAEDCITTNGVIVSFIKILFHGVFGLFFIFLTRNIAISIVIAIFWGLAEGLLFAYLKIKYPDANYSTYLPVTSLNQMLGNDGLLVAKFVIVAMAYQIAMVASAYGLLLKRDIK